MLEFNFESYYGLQLYYNATTQIDYEQNRVK